MRTCKLERQTFETKIKLELNLDGKGGGTVETGVGFFDHMLVLMKKHAQIDLDLACEGDLQVDAHHTVEDCGIVLGQAIKEALGDKAGIRRYATQFVPMDETLVMVSMDISGRPFLVYNMDVAKAKTGDFDTELCEEFFRAVAMSAGITLHINQQYGSNTHHIMEAAFKAFGRSLREAVSIDESIEGVMSTKGML
ncbi:imidazoleglycerol-phosphate dehydratase HisB [Christensenellaceae bacterium OttesenSCG-928-K19]|nr:imidazoleglycerol-phosphate dehydratase HisB [Christensenellaceae bacterium OttesenSCG-928-K19]